MDTFLKRINYLFEDNKITNAQVAEKTGVSEINIIEMRQSGEVSDQDLEKICFYFDIDYLVVKYGNDQIIESISNITGKSVKQLYIEEHDEISETLKNIRVYETAFKAIGVGLFSIDINTLMVICDPTFEMLVGITEKETGILDVSLNEFAKHLLPEEQEKFVSEMKNGKNIKYPKHKYLEDDCLDDTKDQSLTFIYNDQRHEFLCNRQILFNHINKLPNRFVYSAKLKPTCARN